MLPCERRAEIHVGRLTPAMLTQMIPIYTNIEDNLSKTFQKSVDISGADSYMNGLALIEVLRPSRTSFCTLYLCVFNRFPLLWVVIFV